MIVCVRRRVRLLAGVALAALIAAGLSGCQTTGAMDTTGSIAAGPAARNDAEWRGEAQALGEKFRANPRDPDVAIRYAPG